MTTPPPDPHWYTRRVQPDELEIVHARYGLRATVVAEWTTPGNQEVLDWLESVLPGETTGGTLSAMADPEAHDFGWALAQMKAGHAVRRRIWADIQRPDLRLMITRLDGWHSFVAASGGGISAALRCPWTDAVLDVLAEDWELAP